MRNCTSVVTAYCGFSGSCCVMHWRIRSRLKLVSINWPAKSSRSWCILSRCNWLVWDMADAVPSFCFARHRSVSGDGSSFQLMTSAQFKVIGHLLKLRSTESYILCISCSRLMFSAREDARAPLFEFAIYGRAVVFREERGPDRRSTQRRSMNGSTQFLDHRRQNWLF